MFCKIDASGRSGVDSAVTDLAPLGTKRRPGSVGPAAVSLDNVEKRFGEVRAVDGVTLSIDSGEFFSMLGPSGSGKTTTLRLIAGFERPTSGTISLDGEDVSQLPAFDRDVNTVFQDYALFPHMTVAENVGYGLMVRRVARSDRATRVRDALHVMRLDGYGGRKPSELSGGQRQRVALARALVNRPRVLLLDEPLGALDRKLREEMQVELKELQHEVGITFVFVTHDQHEALAMSDRIAVFNGGRVEQVGTPAEIYERPASDFVADFVGTTNVIDAELARRVTGQAERFTVRPERISMLDLTVTPPATHYSMVGRIRDVVYLGADTRYVVSVQGGDDLVVIEQNREGSSSDADARVGRDVRLAWRRENTMILQPDTQQPGTAEAAS
jgi:putative spermidine/putrescine transport system ATP-binding protein